MKDQDEIFQHEIYDSLNHWTLKKDILLILIK